MYDRKGIPSSGAEDTSANRKRHEHASIVAFIVALYIVWTHQNRIALTSAIISRALCVCVYMCVCDALMAPTGVIRYYLVAILIASCASYVHSDFRKQHAHSYSFIQMRCCNRDYEDHYDHRWSWLRAQVTALSRMKVLKLMFRNWGEDSRSSREYVLLRKLIKIFMEK